MSRRTVFMSAGERSGDLHGAAVARELLARDPELRLVGLGGDRMAAAGVERLAGLEDLAVMGFAEVVRRIPFFIRLRRRVARVLEEEAVDLFLPIDYPGFNLPAARRAHALGIPVLYFIAPQVWAWREGRARRLAEACDRVCVILPFEEALLARHGVPATFVGHPLLDGEDAGTEDAGAGDPSGEGGDAGPGASLALFPGSREQEVERILPAFAEAAARVVEARPGTRVAVARAPGLPEALYRDAPGHRVDPETALAGATAALTKSGTITLQLALAGVPMVVGYRTSPVTYRIARHLVRVDHIALANLVAGRRVVPELVQDAMTPEALSRAVLPFLEAGHPERRRVVDGLSEVRDRLGEPGCAARVAAHALELLDRGAGGAARPPGGGAPHGTGAEAGPGRGEAGR